MSCTVFISGLRTHHLLTICTLLFQQLHALNHYLSDGDSYWNSTTDFIPIKNASYGTLTLRTGFYMQFNIQFHGKTLDKTWENIFRIGHVGHLSTDFKCSKNDRFPAMWVDDDSNAFVFDISDTQNCFRQYGNVLIEPSTIYKVIIHYNSSWIHIKLNNDIIINQARVNHTNPNKLGTNVHIYMSTVTSIAANVTLSDIFMHSYDDTSSVLDTITSSPTVSPSDTPTISPTQTPTATSSPTLSKAPTKRPTTFLPTVFMPDTSITDDIHHDTNTTNIILSVTEPQKTTTITYSTSFSTFFDITGLESMKYVRKANGLSFEVIFYILTGCAMGGILFCVCTCCCFGCIINKKIKNLSAHEHDEEQQDMINRQHLEGMNKENISQQLCVDESKLRVYTVSADTSHSVKQTTDESMIISHDPETITHSPTINRIASPSSAISGPSFHSPSSSSSTNAQSRHTIKTPSSTNDTNQTFVDLGSDPRSKSNRPKFTKKFHKRMTKLRENDEQHKLRMTHSVPIMDSDTWNKECGIKIERSDGTEYNSSENMNTVIEIETQETLPSGQDEKRSHLTAVSPLKLSVQYDSTRGTYFNSSYSKNTSNRPVFSNPSTANYSLYMHKPRSPLILDMNVVNDDDEDEETQTETETQHSVLLHTIQQQQQQQSKASSKHYQIQIDYANSEQTATTTTNKRTPITQQRFDVKSMGEIEMDDIESLHNKSVEEESVLSNKDEEELKAERLYSGTSGERGSKRNGSFKSMRRNAATTEIDIDEAIKNIDLNDDDDGDSKQSDDKAKSFLQLPSYDSGMSRISNSSHSSNSSLSASSATSCSTSCSSSSGSSSNSDSTTCSSSGSSSVESSTRCTDINALNALTIDVSQHADDIMSNLSGSSAYYSNATHSYVD